MWRLVVFARRMMRFKWRASSLTGALLLEAMYETSKARSMRVLFVNQFSSPILPWKAEMDVLSSLRVPGSKR